MAQKRMFSMQIVDTDAFLDMSQSAQLLYFHLAMRADDDGFISNPKKVMKMVGIQDDDFKVLVAKRFIIIFESGVCVVKHWRIHNYIQKDRYTPTIWEKEKALIKLKDNNSYTDCVQSVSNLSPQVKIKTKIKIKEIHIRQSHWFFDFWNSYQEVPIDLTGFKNKQAAKKLLVKCNKWTPDLDAAMKKLEAGGFTEEDIKLATKNYMNDILERDPETSRGYHEHRFSILQFLKQSNGLANFINK